MKRTIIALALALSIPALSAHAAGESPAEKKPIAVCQDGKTYYSTSNEHRGACAKHGGVKEWSDGSAVKVRAAKKGEYR